MRNYPQYIEISRFDLKRLRFYIELINKHFPSLHTDIDDKYYEELLEMIDIYLYPHKYPKSKLHINQ